MGSFGHADATFRPIPTRVAQGHETIAGKLAVSAGLADDSRHWPAAGLYLSGEDIARFAVAFVDAPGRGTVDARPGADWVGPFGPCVPYPAIPQDDSFFAGYMFNTAQGTDLVKYGGSGKSYASSLRIAPKLRAAVIVLANANCGSLNPIAENILEAVIGMRLRPNSVPRGPASIEMNTLVGEYRNNTSRARIRSDGRVQMEAGAWEALEHRGDDCYRTGKETICFVRRHERAILYWRERALVRTNP